MSKDNVPASIRQRLLNVAKERNEDWNAEYMMQHSFGGRQKPAKRGK